MIIANDSDYGEYRDLDMEFDTGQLGGVWVRAISTRNSDGFSEKKENLIFIH